MADDLTAKLAASLPGAPMTTTKNRAPFTADLERAIREIEAGKAEVRELVKERGAERDEIAALAQLGVTVSRTEVQQAKVWRLEAPAVKPRRTRSARKAPSQAPAEADPNDVWVPLDRLIRLSLAAYLDAQGFPALATRLRGLAPVTTAVEASALRAVHRELTDAIYAEAFVLGDAAAALRSQGADELEVLSARGRAQSPRFRSADTMCGLVVNVAAEFAASTALSPGPWPTPRQYAAMCLREIAYCEQAIASDRVR